MSNTISQFELFSFTPLLVSKADKKSLIIKTECNIVKDGEEPIPVTVAYRISPTMRLIAYTVKSETVTAGLFFGDKEKSNAYYIDVNDLNLDKPAHRFRGQLDLSREDIAVTSQVFEQDANNNWHKFEIKQNPSCPRQAHFQENLTRFISILRFACMTLHEHLMSELKRIAQDN